ncbi:MAG: pyridoxamine 5'-phosphate oxidase family protein [Promethearchaeota archaeon]
MNPSVKSEDFEKIKKEIQKVLSEKQQFILATSSENRTTARIITCITIDLRILFITGKNSLKVQQISKNSHVALAIDEIALEGIAQIHGHPLNPDNQDRIEAFKHLHPQAFKEHAHRSDEIIIEIIPTIISRWNHETDPPNLEILDLHLHKAFIKSFE